MSRILTHLFVLIAFLVGSQVSFAVSDDVVERGWKPQIELAGDGDSALAVERIKALSDLQRTVFYGLQYHEETQAFVDEVWDSLEKFDLKHIYEMLPQQDGEWRQLQIYGSQTGDSYQVGPDPVVLGLSKHGDIAQLGDLSVQVRAKKIDGKPGNHYLFNNDIRVGIGEMQWPAVQRAAEETFRVMVDGSPSFQNNQRQGVAQSYRDKVIRMNPQLSSEDVDIIAPLWASFPAMWELLSHLGEIEDVVYHDLDKPYRQLKTSFVVDPKKMKQLYPSLSSHLVSMNRLFKGSFRLEDERGELLTAEIDSKSMRGFVELFVANGRIVPIKGGKVVLNAPPMEQNKPLEFTAHMDSTMSILGVVTHIQNAKARVQFLSHDSGMKMVGQLNHVPDIQVQGNALGFMPTALIDVVLPKDLHEIIEEFMSVACLGNEGKGILVGAQFDQGEKGRTSTLAIKSAIEGLDNFFVRIGMGIVSDRVIPDPKVSTDLRKLIFDSQEAFASDLKGFEAVASKKVAGRF